MGRIVRVCPVCTHLAELVTYCDCGRGECSQWECERCGWVEPW